MIYFVCPDVTWPSGGVRTIYRCVDLLNCAGQSAAVLHSRKGFRYRWFDGETRVVYPPVPVGVADVLVFPAHFLARAPSIAPTVRKVFFNQNVYRTFRPAPEQSGPAASSLLHAADVVGVIVVSEDSQQYLEYAFPDLRITRLHHWIDSDLFYLDPTARRRKITTMPRKRPDDFAQVVAILTARRALAGWEFEVLEDRPEVEVAASLRESVLFVSFARAEGFGLPAAEAMASGCHVIGYHGMGGREVFREPFAEAIEEGDTHALASAIEEFVSTYDERAEALLQEAAEASSFIHSTYSRERATDDLTQFFGQLAEGVGSPMSAVVSSADLIDESRLLAALRRHLIPIGRRVLRAGQPVTSTPGAGQPAGTPRRDDGVGRSPRR